jgi:rRNA maturation protein Nop10
MATCPDCGSGVGSQAHHDGCPETGEASSATTVAAPPALSLVDRFVDFLGGRDSAIRIGTYAGAAAVLAAAGYFGGLPLLLLVFPLVAGGVVALARPSAAQKYMARFEAWVSTRKAAVDLKAGKWARYVAQPCLGGFAWIQEATKRIADDFTRAGVRIASYLYFAAVILLAAYIAVAVVVAIVAIILVLLVIGLLLSLMDKSASPSGGFSGGFSRGRSFFSGGSSSPSSGGGTGRLAGTRVVKEGLIFDAPTGVKVNEQGQVMREGLFFDSPTGVKLNESGQVVSEGLLFDTASGTKVNEEGQVVKEGLIFDVPSGYKVNDQGQLVKEGIVFDTPTGIRFKKEEK